MIRKIAIALVVVLAAVLIFAATKPDTFRVERSTSIKAPPEDIYRFIIDFRRWDDWSPWQTMDPGMSKNITGALIGKGAVFEWAGNSEVGAGRMEITDVTPPTRAIIKLDFTRPFEGHNTAEFTLEPRGTTTRVTWAMHGPAPYLSKLMSVFVSMDRMIGKDFETGLANLKTVVEFPPGPSTPLLQDLGIELKPRGVK